MFVTDLPLDLPPITVTRTDAERLRALLGTRVALAYRTEASRLSRELRRATIIDADTVPPNVVTMNSKVSYEDLTTGETKTVTLVYPWRSNERATLNVLSSIGTALLGLRAGDVVEWLMPESGSVKRLRVIAVAYQPEASGHWYL